MVFLKIINFIITVILARLLIPEDFGLVALGFTVVNFFDIFRDMGIGAALIHEKEDVDKSANTAFFLFPLIAAGFFFISYFIAPFAADFYHEPQINSIIRSLSFIFIISSFGTLPNILLDKNLEFNKKVIPQILSKVGYGITAVWMAFSGFGVWSLVYGRLISELLNVLIVWSAVDWHPAYKYDKKMAFELINYGKQVVGGNMLVFIITIVDLTFIGRILGPEDLGFYSIALVVANIFTTQISQLMNRVMFPVYSTIQGDKKKLNKAFVRSISYVGLLSIPSSLAIFLISRDFITVVYGPKWLPAVAALQVLCFYGLNRSLLGTSGNLYMATGKPEIKTKLNLLQLVLMAALMYPLIVSYGILGAAIAATLPSVLVLILTLKEAGKIIGESFSYIARNFVPAITGSLIMALSIWGWQRFAIGISPVIRMGVSIMIGTLVYVGYLWWMNKEILYEIRGLITRR